MNLLAQTMDLCKIYGVVPTKSLGQNFLIDESVLNNIIVNVKKLKENNKKLNILEIGGGFGFLTNKLLDVADRVFVIEKDEKLFNGLKKIEKVSINRMKVVLGDALDLFKDKDGESISNKMKEYFNNEEYIVVANIPYNITAHLIKTLLGEKEYFPKILILMIQKEVALRVCSINNDRSILSVMVNFYSDAKILLDVNRKSFFPEPKVDSSVIELKRIDEYMKLIDEKDVEKFFKFVGSGFLNRRKMLYHNISSSYRLEKETVKNLFVKNGLDEKIRAQDLTVKNWIDLWYNIKHE